MRGAAGLYCRTGAAGRRASPESALLRRISRAAPRRRRRRRELGAKAQWTWEERGPTTGVLRFGSSGSTGRQEQSVRWYRNHRVVCTVDSEGRGPTAGLSDTAGRYAVPLSGRHSRRKMAGSTACAGAALLQPRAWMDRGNGCIWRVYSPACTP